MNKNTELVIEAALLITSLKSENAALKMELELAKPLFSRRELESENAALKEKLDMAYDERDSVSEYATKLEAEVAELKKTRNEIMIALDISVELLPVAEHAQDEEWYSKQDSVFKTYHKFKDLI